MRIPRFRRTLRDRQRASHRYELEPAPEALFERPPADRSGRGMIAGVGKQATCRLTRNEELTLRGAEVPGLTITSDPLNMITVVGSNVPDWTLRFLAYAEGKSEMEAREHLHHLTMTRTGSIVSLNGRGQVERQHTGGSLDIEAPADAPVVIHASYAAVEVRDMQGPVRIATTHARAMVLGTTGQVDAIALVVDFAASRGRVTLRAEEEINIKMTSPRFEGMLLASARRSVRMLVPPGFMTPFEVIVNRPQDFVCRAALCSEIQVKRQDTLYTFRYDGGSDVERGSILRLRSEQAAVVIDSTHGKPAGI
jgi:hypothetical protein